ncbi:MAG: phage portal protein [Parvularculaceae bacterium]|nr:phage portal protein [Parvularculaceae bacterium]
MQVSAISACVRLISGNVAKLPIHVYRLTGDSRRRERGHNVETLLNGRPNSWQSAHEFRRQMTAQVALYGNAVALKQYVGSRIDALIPWSWDRVSVRQAEADQSPVYELRDPSGVSRTYPASSVLHLRDLTLDGVVGMSRIEQARQGIALAMSAETYATSFFMNGAEPGVALETERTLTDAQRNSLIESWKQAHQGAGRAHTPTVLEGGLKIKPTGATNKDSQFLELRSFQVEDIARIFGVPPHLIGLTEKQTSWGSGVEQMAIGFLQFHLLDWIVMWESAIARDLLDPATESEVFAEHLVDGLLRADFKTRMDAYALAIQNGILSRNEARQKENLRPYQGGDEYLYPSNMTVSGADEPAEVEEEPESRTRRARIALRKSTRAALRMVSERSATHE